MDFSFRRATQDDIDPLESIRIRSIENCSIYTREQLDLWQQSLPDWPRLIVNTIVCVNDISILGFAVADEQELDFLYVDPLAQGQGVANSLVAHVEKEGMKCDCNPYSEKVLKRRDWQFLEDNVKEKAGVRYHNKWYVFPKSQG